MSVLRRLELHVPDGRVDHRGLAEVAGLYPAIRIEVVGGAGCDAIAAAAWRGDGFDFWGFDRHVDELVARGAALAISAPGADARAVVREILTRAQRVVARRNAATAGPWFDRVLAAHRELHDCEKPLVRADLDHALDAWQWTLRLDAEAPAAVQLAALLHDIERLTSEAGARVEHRAIDYQAFKDAHAREGGRLARALLERAGVDHGLATEVAALVAIHERAGGGAALHAVNDADALSFFSFNSPGYLAYFGSEQSAKKVAYTLARMSIGARRELAWLRIPREVRLCIERAHQAP